MTTIEIQGSAGVLEARTDQASESRNITAVLCHPHPQYGGSMHDGVVDVAAGVMLDHGIDCVRFNFRGVGRSEGVYDNGIGELDDLGAVANWVRDQNPDHKLWLAGYSFGSNIVFRSLAGLKPEFALLIAPPIGMMEFPEDVDTSNVHAIAGDRDDFVDANKLMERFGDRANILNGADHFFGGYYGPLGDAVAQAINL